MQVWTLPFQSYYIMNYFANKACHTFLFISRPHLYRCDSDIIQMLAHWHTAQRLNMGTGVTLLTS